MKAVNILDTKTGILKLAEFGLAKDFNMSKQQLNRHINRALTL